MDRIIIEREPDLTRYELQFAAPGSDAPGEILVIECDKNGAVAESSNLQSRNETDDHDYNVAIRMFEHVALALVENGIDIASEAVARALEDAYAQASACSAPNRGGYYHDVP